MANGIDRRTFIKTAVAAGVAAGSTSLVSPLVKKAWADKDHILIGRPNPFTGPLAGFGGPSPWAEDQALKVINKEGGIFIKEAGKKLPIKLIFQDTQSNETKASEVASKLILADKVDLMVVLHTPATVLPVSAMCERYDVPCISLDCPLDEWLAAGPYQWCYHAFWSDADCCDAYLGMWEQYANQHNKVVGCLWPNDPDGVAFSKAFPPKMEAAGFKVVDPGRFPFFMKDFSSMIGMFKKAKADIITGCLIPPDFLTFYRQCHQQGYYPKIVTVAKAYLFPTDVGSLGDNLGEGLTCENWWSPYHPFKSSLNGELPKELCAEWTKDTGREWSAPIGFKYAGMELAANALKRAGTLDKKAIRSAIAATNLHTIVGPIKYNAQHYSKTPLVGCQWTKGKKFPWDLNLVYVGKNTEIPVTAKMIFPVPSNKA